MSTNNIAISKDDVKASKEHSKTSSKSSAIPKDGLLGLKENFGADALSGFLVFLLALPLSLGIAKASEFPPVMGLVSAIIGGMVVSFVAGSRLTIKGPAAGLIVIIADAVAEFGHGDAILGWKFTLGAIVIAGILQIVFGFLKLGSLSDFFPASAIHGMLAAIGIIIFSKQIHILLGTDPKELTGMEPLELLAHIPHSIAHLRPHIAMIGVLSLIIIFGLPSIKHAIIRQIPSPMVVLLVAIPFGLYFDFQSTEPVFSLVKVGNFVDVIATDTIKVDFLGMNQAGTFLKYVMMIALVGSIESLLTAKAIDPLDPYKRKSDYNKDLMAVGLGNVVAGVLGGLPMISEVARSSANVSMAKTRWANFFHGFFLLVAILTITPIIEMIPNSALAAMLIAVGYRLASPNEFRKTYAIGKEQLVIFIVTVIATLATDLLIGVAIGILVKLFIELYYYYFKRMGSIFSSNVVITQGEGNHYNFEVKNAATFLNLIPIKKKLEALPGNANITMDFSHANLVDHSFMELIHTMEEDMHRTGGHISVVGLEELTPCSQHPFAVRRRLGMEEDATVFEYKLDKRQIAIQSFANANNWDLETKPAMRLIKMYLWPFVLTKNAQYAENVLIGSKNDFHFFFSDVFIQERGFITKPQFKMTVLMVHDFNGYLPDFSLEREGWFYTLRGLGGSKDIDFEDHPPFSDKYYLFGSNEPAIRKAFNAEVFDLLLEQNSNYSIECHNNRLIIGKDTSLMSVEEMEQELVFAEKLLTAFKVI